MEYITDLLEQYGPLALQIVVGMLVIIVLISIFERHGHKDDKDRHQNPPGM